MSIAALIERRPGMGILASLTGLSTSILAMLQQASIIISFCGACLALVAGYYTFRIKRAHWLRVNKDQ